MKRAKGLNLKGKNGEEKKIWIVKREIMQIIFRHKWCLCDNFIGKRKVSNNSERKVNWSCWMEWTVRIVSNCTWWIIVALFQSPICRTIPSHGNTADINLTVLHRNFLGVDEFLGQVSLPLRDFDVYERPKSNWFPLKCKPGQTKNDYRGEIEVFIKVFNKSFGSVLSVFVIFDKLSSFDVMLFLG